MDFFSHVTVIIKIQFAGCIPSGRGFRLCVDRLSDFLILNNSSLGSFCTVHFLMQYSSQYIFLIPLARTVNSEIRTRRPHWSWGWTDHCHRCRTDTILRRHSWRNRHKHWEDHHLILRIRACWVSISFPNRAPQVIFCFSLLGTCDPHL